MRYMLATGVTVPCEMMVDLRMKNASCLPSITTPASGATDTKARAPVGPFAFLPMPDLRRDNRAASITEKTQSEKTSA